MGTAAAIYCRISEDTEGQALGVARQEQDCRALAARQNLNVVEVYTDNDIGASTRSRAKRRPAYDRMLEDARAGRFRVILAYSNSRLTRRPLELEGLIQLHEQHRTRLITVVSGEDDLSTADGRMVARIKANVDTAEAERTAERVARKHLEIAQSGRPVGGTRPFGWQADRATLDPTEAALIRKAAEDVLAGVPVRAIVREWTEQGVTTPTGRAWQHRTAREMLRSPRLAGWRIHQGKVAIGRDGEPVRGLWEPILDDATHKAVVAALSSPERRTRIPRKGARHYLLTGLLRCGRCNAVMYANKAGDAHYYTCRDNGHVNSASGRAVDAIVEETVLRYLAAEDLTLPRPEFAGQARLDQIAGQISELMAAFTAGTLTGAVVFPAVKTLEDERDALVRERDAVDAAALRPDVSRVDRTTWEGMDTDRRRAVCETVLDAVLVRPTSRNTGNRFDAERLEVVWRRG
jgi:DNA invertase Pin-like site-specific DNA recombinase